MSQYGTALPSSGSFTLTTPRSNAAFISPMNVRPPLTTSSGSSAISSSQYSPNPISSTHSTSLSFSNINLATRYASPATPQPYYNPSPQHPQIHHQQHQHQHHQQHQQQQQQQQQQQYQQYQQQLGNQSPRRIPPVVNPQSNLRVPPTSSQSKLTPQPKHRDSMLRVVGNYNVDRVIGEGSYAKVKLAQHRLTNERVALKIFDKKALNPKHKELEKVLTEIQILRTVNHPNLVRLLEVIETDDEFYLALEYAAGGELFDYIVAHGKISEREGRRIFRQVFEAVEYLHANNIAHRDLKPENVLMDRNRNIRLIDFGMATFFTPGEPQVETCGSLAYAAPEMLLGLPYDCPAIDVWSMGIMLYALLAGYLPFEDPDQRRLQEKIVRGKPHYPSFLSKEAKDLIRYILNTNPKERPTLAQIRNHPWMDWSAITTEPALQILPCDPDVLQQMETLGYDRDLIFRAVNLKSCNDTYATYLLFLLKKRRNGRDMSRNTTARVGKLDFGSGSDQATQSHQPQQSDLKSPFVSSSNPGGSLHHSPLADTSSPTLPTYAVDATLVSYSTANGSSHLATSSTDPSLAQIRHPMANMSLSSDTKAAYSNPTAPAPNGSQTNHATIVSASPTTYNPPQSSAAMQDTPPPKNPRFASPALQSTHHTPYSTHPTHPTHPTPATQLPPYVPPPPDFKAQAFYATSNTPALSASQTQSEFVEIAATPMSLIGKATPHPFSLYSSSSESSRRYQSSASLRLSSERQHSKRGSFRRFLKESFSSRSMRDIIPFQRSLSLMGPSTPRRSDSAKGSLRYPNSRLITADGLTISPDRPVMDVMRDRYAHPHMQGTPTHPPNAHSHTTSSHSTPSHSTPSHSMPSHSDSQLELELDSTLWTSTTSSRPIERLLPKIRRFLARYEYPFHCTDGFTFYCETSTLLFTIEVKPPTQGETHSTVVLKRISGNIVAYREICLALMHAIK